MSYPVIAVELPPPFTVSPIVHNTATAAAALVWLGVAAWAVWLARRHRTPVPLVIMAGGALTVGYEPVVDVLGKCYLPESYQWTLFEVLDRGMPVYAIFVYSAFFGGFALSSWNHLARGGAPAGTGSRARSSAELRAIASPMPLPTIRSAVRREGTYQRKKPARIAQATVPERGTP